MITVYKFDSNLVFTESQECDEYGEFPPCLMTPPPPLKSNQVARVNGSSWEVLELHTSVENHEYENLIPQSVTMRQARLALLGAGLLDDVEAVISAAGRVAQIEWEYAAVVDRSNPAVAAVQQQQALTDAQIDALFREAAKL